MDNSLQIVDTNLPVNGGEVTKRMVADAIRLVGEKEIFYSPDNKKMRYADALAKMIWQALVDGEMYFSDGHVITVREDLKQWIDILKFVSNHLDGAAGANANIGNVNVFKVYQGIEVDRV